MSVSELLQQAPSVDDREEVAAGSENDHPDSEEDS